MPNRPIRQVLFIVYDGFQLLDMSGPASVFANANLCQKQIQYELCYASTKGGKITSESALAVETIPLAGVDLSSVDTAIIAGGPAQGLGAALEDKKLQKHLQEARHQCRRIGSVCSGAFILAEAGLLDGLEVTTHWMACEPLQQQYESLQVNAAALYIRQGKIWTAAGVSTGMDMAMAMIEDDLSADISNQIARNLVLYTRRPGHQQQFSAMLELQTRAGNRFGPLLAWAEENINHAITASDLAARAGMSERSFFRQFQQETGMTPSATIRQLRLEKVRQLIETGMPFKRIAADTGFSSPAHMSAAFKKEFGMTATLYRDMHGQKP